MTSAIDSKSTPDSDSVFKDRDEVLRRHIEERAALHRQQLLELREAGLPQFGRINFDNVGDNQNLLELHHPSGVFRLYFQNANLYMGHDESPEAGGISYFEEIRDVQLDELRDILTDFRVWRLNQRVIRINASSG